LEERSEKLVYILPKYSGGEASHFSHTINFLARLSQQVDLVVVIEQCIGIPVIGKAKCIVIRSKFKIMRLFIIMWALLKLRQKDYKKVYTHCGLIGSTASILLKWVCGFTTYYWHCGLNHLFEKESSKLETRVFKYVLKHIDFLITGTNWMKQYYNKQYHKPLNEILTVPNDIDLTHWKPMNQRKRWGNKILYVHHLSPRKGADRLKTIIDQVPDCEWTIVGDGSYLPKLKEELSSYSNVQILGKIPNPKIKELMESHDIFILCSREEGMSRTILESMSIGLPFVAINIGGLYSYVPKVYHQYLSQDNTEDFCNKLKMILNDVELRKKLSMAGQVYVKQFDLPEVTQTLLVKIQR